MKIILYAITLLLCTCQYSHALEVHAYSVSQDKRKAAIAFDNNIIRVYSLKTGKVLNMLVGHTDDVGKLDFNKNSTKLLSSDWSGNAILWHLDKGDTAFQKKRVASEGLDLLKFTHNGNIISSTDGGLLFIHDNKLNKTLKATPMTKQVVISKDRSKVAGKFYNLRFFEKKFLSKYIPDEDKKTIKKLIAKEKPTNNATGYTAVMDLTDNTYKAVFVTSDGENDLAFSTDATQLVEIASFGNSIFYDLNNQTKKHLKADHLPDEDIATHPTKNELWLLGNNVIFVLDITNARIKKQIQLAEFGIDEMQEFSFSKDGKHIAIIGSMPNETYKIIILDTKTLSSKQLQTTSKKAYELSFIDNHRLAIDTYYNLEVWDIRRPKRVFHLTKKGAEQQFNLLNAMKDEHTPFAINKETYALGFANTNDILVLADDGVRQLNKQGKLTQYYDTNAVSVDASTKGLIALGHRKQFITMHNMKTGKLHARIELDPWEETNALKFSPNGKKLAASSGNKVLYIVNVATKKATKLMSFDDIKTLHWLNKHTLLVGTYTGLYEVNIKNNSKKRILKQDIDALDVATKNSQIYRIAVELDDGDVIILDKNYQEINRFKELNPSDIALNKAGDTLVNFDSDVELIDIATGNKRSCEVKESYSAIQLNKQTGEVFIATENGKLVRQNLDCKMVQ